MALNLDKEYTERPEDQTKCVYCGKVIVTRSKEHIIQNAIGGLYLSLIHI